VGFSPSRAGCLAASRCRISAAAIGAKRSQIVGVVLIEAILATGIGGLCGVVFGMLLLRVFEHSLVYSLTEIGVPFLWLDRTSTILVAAVCVFGAALTGAIGALTPAWRVSRHDPYDLIRGEG
jgi:putative ABC transport system permease protein